MKIYCASMEHFLDVCAGLAKRGVGFTADSVSFTVTLTGAY